MARSRGEYLTLDLDVYNSVGFQGTEDVASSCPPEACAQSTSCLGEASVGDNFAIVSGLGSPRIPHCSLLGKASMSSGGGCPSSTAWRSFREH